MISIELTEKAGLNLIGRIAKMTVEEGRMFLANTDFEPAEVNELLTLCKKPQIGQIPQQDHYYQRRKIMATLWVLGCSWSQIGELYQISRQTVMDGAHKMMGGRRDRAAQRCSYERMSEYSAQYWAALGKGSLDAYAFDPWQVAEYLLTRTELDQ